MIRLALPLAIALVAAAVPASAEEIAGTIDAGALRRKTDLVYIERVDGKFEPPGEPALMNQRGNKYLPHVLPLVAGTKVRFQSEDPELHNVYAQDAKFKVLFNRAQPPKFLFDMTFNDLGPIHLKCNIHKEMSALVLVLQNPYVARPDPKTGEFKIAGVPAGTYTLRIWGEELSPEQNARKFAVTVGGGAVPLKIAAAN